MTMREHLYRGKRFDDKTWIYGSLLENDIIVTKGATDVYEDYIGFSDEWSSVIPETVCEWTGLTDKNGKKIFEGDLVCTQYIDPIFHSTFSDEIDYEDKHEIKFDNGCFFVEIKDKVNLLITALNNKIEVIGTIYDKEEHRNDT